MLLPKTPNERTSETFPSTHSGEYCFFEWHNRCNSGKEQCRDSRAAACSQPIRARRTAGLPVPHGASFHQEPRRGLRGEPPRVLHHGDAQSGRSDKGTREHEEIPRGLLWRRAVAQVSSSASNEGVVGRFPLFAVET